MVFKWIGDTLGKLSSYSNKIGEIELNMLDERQNFREVFERNLALEKEISERTEELNQANKGLLTLKHIWSTMNSSEPLSEVLSTVANSLITDLGYIFCFILQHYEHNNESILKVRTITENSFSAKITEILKEDLFSIRIPLTSEENIITQALNEKSLKTVKSFSRLFADVELDINEEKIEKLDSMLLNRSISVLPLIVQDKSFGCLVAISIRGEISNTEKNFLSLFAGQTELAITIAGLFEQIRNQAITDGLTGVYNRRYFDQCLANEVERSLRLKQPFTLITLDLDHLKKINDTLGHSAGDAAICRIGAVLLQNARSVDIPARFGGEEFALVLPGIDIEGGMIAAERLRSSIADEPIEGVGTVTASIGVATFLRHTDSLGELLEIVDQAMYRAKRNGRNQVQLAVKPEDDSWQQQALDAFVDILSKKHVPIAPEISQKLTHKLTKAQEDKKDSAEFLYYIADTLSSTYDPYHPEGCTREKVELVTKIAEEINLGMEEINQLKLATVLHDIGNLMMPENILLKPGPLTKDEKKKVLEHPIIGARKILKPIKSAEPIISVVENHHEHYNGTGFPGSLSGEDIPISSRIILLVDAYFALITDRSYRKAFSLKKAVKILKNGANNEWDGKLVNILIEIVTKDTVSSI